MIAEGGGGRRSGISAARVEAQLQKAFSLSNLQAVALIINSPGGAPAQCELIGSRVQAMAKKHDVPIYAFIEDVAASGGYWLACLGEQIYAQRTSIVGSIGVISASFGLEDFIKRYDIHRRIYTSGKEKSFLDPFTAEDEKAVKRLKALQKEIHGHFIDWVEERRGDRLSGKKAELFEGQFWAAETALELGLIDGIGEARAMMQDMFGEEIKCVTITPEKSFIAGLFSPDARLGIDEDRLIDAAHAKLEEATLRTRLGL